MNSANTPACTIARWLKANYGPKCLGGLTGQDWAALKAAAEILGCYAKCDAEAEPLLLSAFRSVVMTMLPHNRWMAYQAIAAALDWHCRPTIWEQAELPPLEGALTRGVHEPEGAR